MTRRPYALVYVALTAFLGYLALVVWLALWLSTKLPAVLLP